MTYQNILDRIYKHGKTMTETEALMIITAVEKQIPQFVRSKGFKGMNHTVYKCPRCGKSVRNGTNHCDKCGQSITFPKLKLIDGHYDFDWSED